MSGPKVVVVRTREELQAICRRLMARATSQLDRVRARAKQLDLWSPALEEDLRRRAADLERLYDENQFTELQLRIASELSTTDLELQRIEEAAIAARAAARAARRHAAAAASSVREALVAAGIAVPVQLDALRSLERADDRQLAVAYRVIDEAMAMLTRSRTESSAGQGEAAELAKRLAAGERRESLAEWRAACDAGAEQRAGRLDRLLAEIETLEDAEAAAALRARASELESESRDDRRTLLIDSLTLDLASHRKTAREVAAWTERLRDLLAALRQVSASAGAREIASRIERKLAASDRTVDEGLVRDAEQVLAGESRARAAEARRKAVLEGLSALGYEIRESMAAAWAEQGRVVVRKPGAQDYGVELAAPGDVERLQVRVVRAEGVAADAQRDKDAETIWCGEFERLRGMVGLKGNEIVIERAVAPGETSVKAVAFERATDERERAVDKPKSRARP